MSVGATVRPHFFSFGIDRYGRKQTLIGGAILMVIGIILQVAAQNIGMFVAARFILGLGDIIVIVTFPMLITEIAPSQDRAVLVTLFDHHVQKKKKKNFFFSPLLSPPPQRRRFHRCLGNPSARSAST